MTIKLETEVGEAVLNYLADCKCECYCEVKVYSSRIDIVAVSGSIYTTIELKTRLSLDVLGQAIDRRNYGHRSVAVYPDPKRSSSKDYTPRTLSAIHASTGIGIWTVHGSGSNAYVREIYRPTINRRPHHLKQLKKALCPEQMHQAAGVNKAYWSPFVETKRALINFVEEHQGCTLKDAIREIKHHYATHSTAYNSMGKWIREGVIKELEYRDKGLFTKQPTGERI